MNEDVPLTEREIRSHVSPIAEAWKKGAPPPKLEELLTRVLQDSDNTAGDKLVTLNGGGTSITAQLRKIGITGVDIAEEEIDIFARINCAGTPKPKGGWSEATMRACSKVSPDVEFAAAKTEIETSPNGASANALAAMLEKIDRGEVLSPASRAWLMLTLEGTTTGPKRLKGLLPPGTRVAHKTGTGEDFGTFNMATNDVGIAWLPDGTHLVIAALTSGCAADRAGLEATIARAAKAAYDAFAPP
jgi:beta-lactamase class A